MGFTISFKYPSMPSSNSGKSPASNYIRVHVRAPLEREPLAWCSINLSTCVFLVGPFASGCLLPQSSHCLWFTYYIYNERLIAVKSFALMVSTTLSSPVEAGRPSSKPKGVPCTDGWKVKLITIMSCHSAVGELRTQELLLERLLK